VTVNIVIPNNPRIFEACNSSRTDPTEIEYPLTLNETRAQNMIPTLEMIHCKDARRSLVSKNRSLFNLPKGVFRHSLSAVSTS
jgi:hypothetical protein